MRAAVDAAADVRARLLALLEGRGCWHCAERRLSSGSCVDVAALSGGELLGFEIKSARDTLARLAPPGGRQVADFSEVFDRVTLVCAAKHLPAALAVVPPWWGILRAEDLGEHRPAAPNPSDPMARLTRVLWATELRAVAESLSMDVRGMGKAKVAALFAPAHEAALRAHLALALPARRRRNSFRAGAAVPRNR